MSNSAPTPRYRPIHLRQTVIGQQLRSLYAGIAQQPVPQAFLDLLGQADRQAPMAQGEA